MKKTVIFLTILTAFATKFYAQTIEFDFPKLKGDTVWIYTFTGNGADSMSMQLSNAGKATMILPFNNYRGYSYIYIPQKGVGEFILAEDCLQITCPEENFNTEMLAFPQSKENAFLRWAFQQRNYLPEQLKWLQAGEFFVSKEDKEVAAVFNRLLEENNKANQQLDDTIKNSSLYSARFMELIIFLQQMYNTVQSADTARQSVLRNEMQYTLDISALYHAGNLWTDIHTYYPGLFVGRNGELVEEAYATSVGLIMQRLQEPVMTAFLSSALTICERANFAKAQELMLRDFVTNYPSLPVVDPMLKRMLGTLAISRGSKMPPVTGLSKPVTQPAIIIFFDSDCDHCIHETDWLTEHYQELTAKGYRIISIASDMQPNNYQTISSSFPWVKEDRLCDFKGFAGENFKNYGIIGTPTIFMIDKDGLIMGKYAQMIEVKELLLQ